MKTLGRLLVLSLMAVLNVLPSAWSVMAQASAGKVGQVINADKLVGQNINDNQGAAFGKISNLVVDLTSGRVLYAIVDEQGGKPGIDRFAIPTDKFVSGSNPNNLMVNLSKAKLANAPRFKGGAEAIQDASFAQQVYTYFGSPAWWGGSGGTFGNNVHGAKQLIGVDVKTVGNQELGQIKNLVVDWSAGHVLYVILSPAGKLGAGNVRYPIPPNAFTAGANGTLVSGLDDAKLQGAPHFAANQWPDVAGTAYATQVYQYYGKQPYFNTSGQLAPTSNR